MAQRNYKKVLALGVICLSLVFGQASVFAASNTVMKAAPGQVSVSSTRHYIIVDGLRVRSEPNTSSTILGLLYKGQYIDVEYYSGDWAYGKTSTGIWGWISLYV